MEFSIFAVDAAVSARCASTEAMFSENIFQEMLENIILSFADYREKSLPLCSLLTLLKFIGYDKICNSSEEKSAEEKRD